MRRAEGGSTGRYATGRVDAWVVDASVAFGWFAAVPGSEQAVLLLEASPPLRLIAADLVLIDLLNAGWRSQRAGAITREQLEGIAAAGATHRWCRLLDHPDYDCLYLALALEARHPGQAAAQQR